MLKFGTVEESMEGAERLNKLFAKIAESKVIYVLVALAAFVLVGGALDKFTG